MRTENFIYKICDLDSVESTMEKIAVRKIEDIKTTDLELEFIITVMVPTLRLIFSADVDIFGLLPLLPIGMYLGFEWVLGPY